ncbi:MAG TPA: YraN family protein [Alphaproteobacteria bacterium]|nr:YraN family protein [Alphaproteobacteria bacterium]HOO50482.1 YraN family protein [Alphaproteobacteria bacterium]
MKNKLFSDYRRGMFAEFYAAAFLILKGYSFKAWRYKTPVGEVDLIFKKSGKIIFVEVKLRPSRDEGMTCITPKMKSRISRAAQHYMQKSGNKSGGIEVDQRFDVVVVSGFRIWHLDNAWFPSP